MKKNNILVSSAILAIAMVFAYCTKGEPYQYKETASFSYTGSGGFYVTTDLSVKPKDSLYFQFNANSSSPMARILLRRNATVTDTLTPQGNSFSFLKKTRADSVAGIYTYSATAYNAANVIMGVSNLVVTVNPDFTYYTNRTLFVPDSTAKTNNTYFGSTTGLTYSYAGIGGKSAQVDFGYFYDSSLTTAVTTKHSLYALTANPVTMYDVSSWTKNATIFKKLPSNVNFATQLTSGGAINAICAANLGSGTTNKISGLAVGTGNLIGFRTAAGKYGVVLVNLISANSPNASTYISIDVKVAN